MSVEKCELVSICIPTYNNEEFIARTINSVLKQSYPNIEIIVCDDCSTDCTVAIARSIADPRIRIIENTVNKGITSNWNASVENATGKYVKLLCGDDLIHINCIEKQVKIFQEDIQKEISLVACKTNIIDSHDTVLFQRKSLLKTGFNNSKKTLVRSILVGTNIIGEPMTGLFRREHFNEHSQYDGSNPYMIDIDFWVKLMQHGHVYLVPELLASFRISSSSLSSSLQFRQWTLFCKYINKLRRQKMISFFTFLIGTLSSFTLGIIRNAIFLVSGRN